MNEIVLMEPWNEEVWSKNELEYFGKQSVIIDKGTYFV